MPICSNVNRSEPQSPKHRVRGAKRSSSLDVQGGLGCVLGRFSAVLSGISRDTLLSCQSNPAPACKGSRRDGGIPSSRRLQTRENAGISTRLAAGTPEDAGPEAPDAGKNSSAHLGTQPVSSSPGLRLGCGVRLIQRKGRLIWNPTQYLWSNVVRADGDR
jgi:hypothetical protein